MSRSILKEINGQQLKMELERRNITYSEASQALGFSSGVIGNGIRTNKLSLVMINGLKLRYNIDPDSYVISEHIGYSTSTKKEEDIFSDENMSRLYKVIYSAMYEAVKKAWSEL